MIMMNISNIGGRGILVPRYWNSMHTYEGNIVEYIDNQIKGII